MKFDDIRKLHQKKYREEFGHYLVEGEHLILELEKAAAGQPALRSAKVYVAGAHENWQGPFEKHVVSNRRMEEMTETKTPQGIVAVVPMTPAAAAGKDERAIYLYEIQDPGNLGTILRTLAWFGGFRCLLGPGSVDPYNSKVIRATAGAIFHVAIEVDVPVASLRQRFPRIACLDMQGRPLQSADFRAQDCYVFGNEARGVPRAELAALDATFFSIRGSGTIESLNVASTVNMCAYELNR